MFQLLLIIIYLSFISLGLPDALLGAAWPSIHQEFQVPVSYAGVISMIISVGTIISSLQSDRLTRKLGTGKVTAVSVAMTAVALFGFSISHSFVALCLWAIPYGLGAGSVDASLNNYVALHYNPRHMSWLHCFWGLGTIISPYVMSYALTTSVWQNGDRMVSFIQIGIALILFVTLPIWKVNKKETAQEEKAEEEMVGIKGALKIKGVPNLLLGFFSYCALESAVILWGSSYLVGAKGISAERAAAFASLFCIGITLGRFLASFITEKMGDHKMIVWASLSFLLDVSVCCYRYPSMNLHCLVWLLWDLAVHRFIHLSSMQHRPISERRTPRRSSVSRWRVLMWDLLLCRRCSD